jgi:hypothetical protein
MKSNGQGKHWKIGADKHPQFSLVLVLIGAAFAGTHAIQREVA